MKRTAIDHPKIKKFARVLGLPRAHAIGLIECLWHFTAKHAIVGDIGRWSDAEIAEGALWEGDPAEFMAAIIESGLADHNATHRVVIHDWHEHCDESTKKTVRNKGLVFASIPETSGNFPEESGKFLERSGNLPPKPEPEPKPKPEPLLDGAVPDGAALASLTDETLRDTGRLLAWQLSASSTARPIIPPGDRGELLAVGLAERAIEHGDKPVAMFVSLVRSQRWDAITEAQEARAKNRIEHHKRGPPKNRKPSEPRSASEVAAIALKKHRQA